MSLRRALVSAFTALLCAAASLSQASVLNYRAAFEPEGGGGRTGSGIVNLYFDTITHDLTIDLIFEGLSAPTSAAHIHCCTTVPNTGTAPVVVDSPSLVGFPLGVTSGVYLHVFDLDDPLNFTPAFVAANGGTAAGATAALLAGLDAERAYFNIHTSAFPGGEIRGFPALIAAPGSLPLLAFALLALPLLPRRDQFRPR